MSSSKTNDTGVQVPACFGFGDGLEADSAVADALHPLALGAKSKAFEAALQRARAAEWNLFRATTTGLAEDLARLELHLAEIQTLRQNASGAVAADLDLGIRNTQALIESKRVLLAACPEEEERRATQRAREERRWRYEARSTPRSDAEVTAMLDLTEAVQADAAAQAAEQAVVDELVAQARSAQAAGRKVLANDLLSAIHEAARACKAAVGSKALRYAAFPAHAPAEIGNSWNRAVYLAEIVRRLGLEANVEAIFESTIGEDDWRTLAGPMRGKVIRTK